MACAESIRHLGIRLQFCEMFVYSFVYRVFWEGRVQFGTQRTYGILVQFGTQMVFWEVTVQIGTYRFLWKIGVQFGERMVFWDVCLQIGTHRFLWNDGVQFYIQDLLGC
jgi:hypothetical protein